MLSVHCTYQRTAFAASLAHVTHLFLYPRASASSTPTRLQGWRITDLLTTRDRQPGKVVQTMLPFCTILRAKSVPVPDIFGIFQPCRVRHLDHCSLLFLVDPAIVGIVSFTEQHQPTRSYQLPIAGLTLTATILPKTSYSCTIVEVVSR